MTYTAASFKKFANWILSTYAVFKESLSSWDTDIPLKETHDEKVTSFGCENFQTKFHVKRMNLK